MDLVTVGLTTIDVHVASVDALPGDGDTVLVDDVVMSPAGTAGGCATIASKLGLSTELVTKVGDDRNGRMLRALLDEEGVGTQFVEVTDRSPTSMTMIPISSTGQRPNFHRVGASMWSSLSDDAVQAAIGAEHFHLGGVGYPKLCGPAFIDALGDIRASGTFVTADLIAPGPDAMERLSPMLRHIDVFMPSVAEVAALLGTNDVEAGARRFITLGAQGCVVKRGAHGSVGLFGSGRSSTTEKVPARMITPVDTTSCGDAYVAGFIAATRGGASPAEAMRYATATASLVALGVGTTGMLDSDEQVREIVAQQLEVSV